MVDIHKLQPGDTILITDKQGNQQVEIVKSIGNEGVTTIGVANEKSIALPIRDIQLLNNFTTNSRRYYYHKVDR